MLVVQPYVQAIRWQTMVFNLIYDKNNGYRSKG